MPKQIIISGDSKAELIAEALEVIEMLSNAPASVAAVEGVVDEPPAPEKPKARRAPKKKGPTKDQLRDAVQAAIDTHGEAPVKEVFKKHDAKKFSDFKPSQFAAVIKDLGVLDELADEEDEDVDLT